MRRIGQDMSDFRYIEDPGHPDAIKAGEGNDDKIGFVAYPNIYPAKEMVDGMQAARAYEANIAVLEVTKGLMRASLDIIS